eukprot:83931-Pyramimonas_sp.AAC.1
MHVAGGRVGRFVLEPGRGVGENRPRKQILGLARKRRHKPGRLPDLAREFLTSPSRVGRANKTAVEEGPGLPTVEAERADIFALLGQTLLAPISVSYQATEHAGLMGRPAFRGLGRNQ